MGIIIVSLIVMVIGIVLCKVKNPTMDRWGESITGLCFGWGGGIVAVIAGFVLFIQTLGFPAENEHFKEDRAIIFASIDNTNMTEGERARTIMYIHSYNNTLNNTRLYHENWWFGKYWNNLLLDTTVHTNIDVSLVPPVKFNIQLQSTAVADAPPVDTTK